MKRKNLKPASTNISTVVPPDKRKRLEQIAKAEHRNLSQIVRIAIDEYLERREAAA